MASTSILVVDRHASFLQIVARFLEERGYVVVGTAFEPAHALMLAAAYQPRVVVVGLNGGAQSGRDLIAGLRAAVPDLSIIVTSQLAFEQYRRAALEAGADRFLGKDTLHLQLIATIAELVGRQAMPVSGEPEIQGGAPAAIHIQ